MDNGGWNFLDAEGGDDEDGEGEDSEEEGTHALHWQICPCTPLA